MILLLTPALQGAKWFGPFCVVRAIWFAVCSSGLERMRKRKRVTSIYMLVEQRM